MTPDERTELLQQIQQAQEWMRAMIHPAKTCQCDQGRETPLATAHRVWRQIPAGDRLRFLVEMLTPNERRALQFGFDEADDG